MNLHWLASGTISCVNPQIAVDWTHSSGGYTTDATGHRAATVTTSTIQAQVQALSASDLQHTDGLNIQGVKRTVFMFGNVQGVVRADQQGGDILAFSEVPGGSSRNWRVVQVLETWPDWCKVVVVLQ